MYAESYEIRVRELGPDHPEVAESLSSLADAARARGDLALAEQRYVEAIAKRSAVLGPDHPLVTEDVVSFASVLADLDRLDEARVQLERAVASYAETRGPAHGSTAIARAGLGQVLFELGEIDEAHAQLSRAVRDLDAGQTEPVYGHDARFGLAKVTWAVGEHEQALTLAREAQRGLAEHPGDAALRAQIDAWIAERSDVASG